VRGKLNLDMSLARKPLGAANLAMYIRRNEIAAIEVFDSPDEVHEPQITPSGACVRIVLIWSKSYQQLPWAGH
jgi:hypothetical protein